MILDNNHSIYIYIYIYIYRERERYIYIYITIFLSIAAQVGIGMRLWLVCLILDASNLCCVRRGAAERRGVPHSKSCRSFDRSDRLLVRIVCSFGSSNCLIVSVFE